MDGPLAYLMLVFGIGFFAAILLLMVDVWQYGRRRPTAVLTWLPPRPWMARVTWVVAAGLAALIAYKLFVLDWPAAAVFGEGMMFLYYAVWYPLGLTVQRGFYQQGIWLERRFVRYGDITGLTWREDATGPVLIIVAGHRQQAGHIGVPLAAYAEARTILRDRIRDDQLHMQKPLLDLGGHDRRDDV